VSFDTEVLARKKFSETGHSVDEWRRVFENARTSLTEHRNGAPVELESLEQFALASRRPEQFTLFARLVYQHAKAHGNSGPFIAVIFQSVNVSPFSLTDWLDAIESFHAWLVDHRRKIDFLPMVKYLQCCVEAPDALKSGHTLKVLVVDMLAEFDYEAG
jgi:hypothetical protein